MAGMLHCDFSATQSLTILVHLVMDAARVTICAATISLKSLERHHIIIVIATEAVETYSSNLLNRFAGPYTCHPGGACDDGQEYLVVDCYQTERAVYRLWCERTILPQQGFGDRCEFYHALGSGRFSGTCASPWKVRVGAIIGSHLAGSFAVPQY